MLKRTTVCRWCGGPVAQVEGVGRVREFCSNSHKSVYHTWVRAGLSISLAGLAERDGYRCGICTGPVDMAAAGDERPSIDHILPASAGGLTVAENLQLAHVACNLKKRDRVGFTCPPIGTAAERQQLSLWATANDSV